METVTGLVVDAGKSAVPPLMRQIDYYLHYKKYLEELARKVQDLKNTKVDVQKRVHEAKSNLEPIKKVVEAWIDRVDLEINNLDQTLMVGYKKGTSEAAEKSSRYNRGKEAQKKIVSIDELLNEGKSFDVVSYPFSSQSIMPIIGGHIVALASRESTLRQVMAALKDKGTYIVGIHGKGGVGKTTLMNQVAKQAMQEKIFDMVVMITTVPQDFELEKVQGELAEQLGLKQLHEVDNKFKRSAMLYERLKQEEKILVIFDDLQTDNLDLFCLGISCGENSHEGCKVLITTRSVEVCTSMLSQENIEVGVLSKDESWDLFKKNAGDVVDSPALQTVAREIVEECGGLPLALVRRGRELRNKEKLTWDHTAIQLKTSTITYLDEGMTSKVVSSIQPSCDGDGELTAESKPVMLISDVREPWMNSYSPNDNWVTADQLRWQPYTGMDDKMVSRSDEHVDDTPTTNVSSSCFLRPVRNGWTWPQLIVKPSGLSPNPNKAKFDRNVWVIISNFGGEYVGTYP